MALRAETVRGIFRVVRVHPIVVRVTHWLIAASTIVMIGSGWRIYNEEPIFAWLRFPQVLVISGDPKETYRLIQDSGLSNALLWHFAGMWLFGVAGLVYLVYGLVSGRFRAKLFPIYPGQVLRDLKDALTFRLRHDDISVYNAVQRLTYLGVMLAGVLVVLSGLAIWKPVQFQTLALVFYDFQGARLAHFLCMGAIVAFLIVHVALALLVPKSLVAMVTGRARVGAPNAPDPKE